MKTAAVTRYVDFEDVGALKKPLRQAGQDLQILDIGRGILPDPNTRPVPSFFSARL
jgi:hypothetical protein